MLGDGLFHHVVGIAEIDAPQTAHGVDRAMAVNVGNRDAGSAGDDFRRVGLHVAGGTHRMPEVAGVVFLEEFSSFMACPDSRRDSQIYVNLIKSYASC